MASGFVTYLLELLGGEGIAQLGRPSARAMFGGHGLYLGDRMVGLVAADALYLKTDEQTRARFEAAGSQPFEYRSSARAKPIVMSYWAAPAEALEDEDALREWLELANAAAVRAAAARTRRKPRRSGKR